MTEEKPGRKHVGSFLTASVALALYILIFEVITTSRNMALAFNIPNQYVGIYFDKVFALSNSFTTIGSIIDIAIYYAVKELKCGSEDIVRKGMSVFFLFLMFICRILFVIILYKSRSMSYHFYILFSVEAFFFGFAQISYFAFAGEFSSANTLAINCSALLAFLVQSILDLIMPSNPLKMLRIHSFICFGLTLFSLCSWPFFLFGFDAHFGNNAQSQPSSVGNGEGGRCKRRLARSTRSQPEPSESLEGCYSDNRRLGRSTDSRPLRLTRSDVSYSSTESLVTYNSLNVSSTRLPNLLYVSEMLIMNHIVEELKRISSCCNNMSVSISIRDFIYKITQISSPNQIDYELLVTLDLIIVGIKKSVPCQDCLLLRQLVLFLRIKTYMNGSGQSLTQASVVMGPDSQVLTLNSSSGSEAASTRRSRREANGRNGGECSKEQKQESQVDESQNNKCSEDWYKHFGKSISRFLLFHIPSFFKDFLFPGVLPFGLLDMNNCKLAIKLVPIFSVLGSLTNYIWSDHIEKDGKRNENWDKNHYDSIWILLIPMIIVYICSLSAIHSNKRFFRAIVNSQWRVIIMMLPLLYFYAFMENVSYSGVAGYVFTICPKNPPKYVLETHNLTCMIFRYLFVKFAVGYSNVRIKSGYVLPNFRPVPGLDDTFCYWFCNVFKQAGIDIGKDFKLSIREYL